jgi:hypothetical protein
MPILSTFLVRQIPATVNCMALTASDLRNHELHFSFASIFLFSQGMIIKSHTLVQVFSCWAADAPCFRWKTEELLLHWCLLISILTISTLFIVSDPFQTKVVADKQEPNNIFEEFCHLKSVSLYRLIVKNKFSAVSLQVFLLLLRLTLFGC